MKSEIFNRILLGSTDELFAVAFDHSDLHFDLTWNTNVLSSFWSSSFFFQIYNTNPTNWIKIINQLQTQAEKSNWRRHWKKKKEKKANFQQYNDDYLGNMHEVASLGQLGYSFSNESFRSASWAQAQRMFLESAE